MVVYVGIGRSNEHRVKLI
jgi:hypothetical protein